MEIWTPKQVLAKFDSFWDVRFSQGETVLQKSVKANGTLQRALAMPARLSVAAAACTVVAAEVALRPGVGTRLLCEDCCEPQQPT